MSENQNHGARDLSKYDSMTMEELDEVLWFDPESPDEEEPDVELLLHVLEVRANRRRNNNEVTGNTTLEDFEAFKRDYMIDVEDMDTEQPAEDKPKIKPLHWLRGLVAAAAVVVFMFLGTVTANAFGFDVWKVVAIWAQETFHLASEGQGKLDEPNTNRELEYDSLADALYKVEKVSNLVPTWIPEEYEFADFFIDENPLRKKYIAVYQYGEEIFKISVSSYQDNNPEQIEQSDSYVETYEVLGIKYYIFADNDCIQAAWINGSYECYISGELTIEELKEMINSIEER